MSYTLFSGMTRGLPPEYSISMNHGERLTGTTMYEALLVIFLLVSIGLVVLIMLQQGKGADMGPRSEQVLLPLCSVRAAPVIS